MSDDSSHPWIDEELRRVPLPDGLLARLRAVGELTDQDIDALLRQVAVPAGLHETLCGVVEDERIAARVRDVPIPDGFAESLLAIPLDEQLRDVAVPADLMLHLRAVAPPPRRQAAYGSLALAASLLLAIGMAYSLAVSGMMLSAYDQLPDESATVFSVAESPLDLTIHADADLALAIDAGGQPDARGAEMLPLPPDRRIAPGSIDTRPVIEQFVRYLPGGHQPLDSLAPLKYGILGDAIGVEDRVPDLELIAGPQPRGLVPPALFGFDRQFLITERTQPVVSLDAAARAATGETRRRLLDALRQCDLPLWTKTSSYDELAADCAEGRLPSPQTIHVEDFLAAFDFQYPPARPQELALRAYAGPSAFGASGAKLLQIGVQAGPIAAAHAPAHVTIAIDISDSMRWEGRKETAQQALRPLLAQLSPRDRVTLIAFNDEAYVLAEDVSQDMHARLLSTLAQITPHGGSNFGAGLREAAAAATSAAATALAQRHLVVIGDGAPGMSPVFDARLAQLGDDLRTDGVQLHLVDVRAGESETASLAPLAETLGARLVQSDDPQRILTTLASAITGGSPVLAEDAMLRVKFNPQSVRAYRLLGHEATTLGGMAPAEIESTLLAGQSATALFEVWLTDSGPADVADVEVQWRTPGGDAQRRRQEVRRVQFVPSFREAPLALQAATIVAEGAEVLRLSPFAEGRDLDLDAVLALAEEVNPRLQQRDAFVQLVELFERAKMAGRPVP